MTTTVDARDEFIRTLDRIEREKRDPNSAEDRVLRLAFEHMLDCHYPPVVTTLRAIRLDVKRDAPSKTRPAVISVDEWRRKLAAVL